MAKGGLEKLNEKNMIDAAINNTLYPHAYIEYQLRCPFCDSKVIIVAWPTYHCNCSQWVFAFEGKYTRRTLDGKLWQP